MEKKQRTELVFIVDKSGSMYGMEADTVGGINAVLDANRKMDGEVTVSAVFFNDRSVVVNDRVSIDEIAPLTVADYQTSGCTALLDAVGGSIRHIARVQRYMPAEYKADKVIFVITTDGLENASRSYTYDKVRKMISEQTEKGWEFLFLAAIIDAAAEAGRLGIAEDRACDYVCDTAGNNAMYESVAEATVCMRAAAPQARVGASWKQKIMADKASRFK